MSQISNAFYIGYFSNTKDVIICIWYNWRYYIQVA